MSGRPLPRSACAPANSPAASGALTTAISLALGTTLCGTSQAQEQRPQTLPKISVAVDETSPYKVDQSSSSKYTAPLRDTPQSVTVIPQAVLQAQNATTLRDVLRNTPGITFQAGEGGAVPGDQNFTLRGFSAKSSLFIDGFRDVGSYARDAFFIDRVEVAKGPTAAIAGRSATGGAINQVSKRPTLDTSRDLSVGLGTDEYKRITADINEPFGDAAALRLNLMYHDADVPDRDIAENQRWGVAPSLALGLGTPTRLTFGYIHIEQDNVPDYGLPWNTPLGDGAGIDLDPSNYYGLEDYDFEDLETDVATVWLQHDVSDSIVIENALRYLDTVRDSAITAPRPPRRQLQRRTTQNELWANQTNLLASFDVGSVSHSVTAGVELSREETDNRRSAHSDNQPPIVDVANPDSSQSPLGPMPPNNGPLNETTVDTIGVYAFDTLSLTEQWQLTGGLRWDSFDVEYTETEFATGTRLQALQSSDSVLSWQAGVVYKPRENGSVYLSYGTSFDPSFDSANAGAELSEEPDASSNVNLEPEESRNYELGTKWDLLDGALGVTAALFRTEKTNARTRTARGEPYVMSGEQRVDGIELSASGNLTPDWLVFAGFAYMRTDIGAAADPAEVSNELALTPEKSFNVWTSYQFASRLMIGAGVQYLDNVFRNATNTTEVPSYWLLDAMASYPLSQRVTLQLNATNLADEEYVDRVGGGHFMPGAGRTVSLMANVNF